MRVSISILALLVLATACKRHRGPASSSDEAMPKKFAGVWSGELKYSSGSDSLETMELALDGTFAVKISIPKRQFGPRTIEMNGTWRIENGFLIETTTSDSQTKKRLPSVWRAKIVRIDDRELELDAEKIDGVGYPTNQLIFRKQTR